jgi:hypothetical protein
MRVGTPQPTRPKFSVHMTPREEPSIAMGEGAKCNIMSMFPWPPIAEQEEVIEMSSQNVNKARLAKGQ